MVRGGDLAGGPAAELEIQIRGTEQGEAMGSAAAAADVDGDGQLDLIVGASGVYPGERPGKVLDSPVRSTDRSRSPTPRW